LRLLSKHFKLGKEQAELDFVDVDLQGDVPLFVDPFAISLRTDALSIQCHQTLIQYFARVVEAIRSGQVDLARELLSHLSEPNEIRFGYSKGRPQGAGIGENQSEDVFKFLLESTAVKTGFVQSLEECELLIPGISWDKISDLTTNVIRAHLADYTVQQCELLGIKTQETALPPVFDLATNGWVSRYFLLPIVSGLPVLLVPKVFARYHQAYDHRKYYRHFVLNYLRAEHLEAGTSLVRTLRNGRRTVFKRDLEKIFPCTKENLFQFSRENPEVLKQYRSMLADIERGGGTAIVDPEQEKELARALGEALRSIPPGSDSATSYHYLMIGIVEFLFYPHLLHPKKEQEIHDGRKRIDIVMENGATTGIFSRLESIAKIPCPFVVFECKNYSKDVANPELDQISSRFAPHRGKVGFLCCRAFADRETFVKRCRDTFREDRGLVVPLDDRAVMTCLDSVAKGKRAEVDKLIGEAANEIRFA